MVSINLEEILFNKNKNLFDEVERKADSDLIKLFNYNKVQENIFNLFKRFDDLHFFGFPIKDDKLYAFTLLKENRCFIYINTYLPKNSQIFGAAHELYHYKYEKNKSEILKDAENMFTGNENEMVANSYAACFLVPKKHLFDDIRLLNIDPNHLKLINVLELMEIFAIPFKAMVLRLYETGIINDVKANEFLNISQEDINEEMLIKQLSNRWYHRSGESFFGKFYEFAEKNYLDANFSMEKILEDLKSINSNEETINMFKNMST
jgi:Zn-dependent peptidase ImmA (M78 family)